MHAWIVEEARPPMQAFRAGRPLAARRVFTFCNTAPSTQPKHSPLMSHGAITYNFQEFAMLKKTLFILASTLAFGTLAQAHPRDARYDDHYRSDSRAHIQQDRARLESSLARRQQERRELHEATHHGDIARIRHERRELALAEARVRQDRHHLRDEREARRGEHYQRY